MLITTKTVPRDVGELRIHANTECPLPEMPFGAPHVCCFGIARFRFCEICDLQLAEHLHTMTLIPRSFGSLYSREVSLMTSMFT